VIKVHIQTETKQKYHLQKGDCLELMKDVPDGSIDMILCDLPYESTSSRWDKAIPLNALWGHFTRIIKGNGAIVLFGAEPFASKLRMSAPDLYKYDWVWVKNNAVGFVNAKLKPMNKHEVICVFSKGKTSNGNQNNMPYYPQGLVPFGREVRSGNKSGKDNTYWRPSLKSSNGGGYIQQFTNYPTTVLQFDKVQKAVHPTQKPVPLLEYLIRTYTPDEGATVLDNCMGSGSTGVACANTGRKFIGMELDDTYFNIASERVSGAFLCAET
jgi:site-specific DNA-methyltransferase (adenine-specific)